MEPANGGAHETRLALARNRLLGPRVRIDRDGLGSGLSAERTGLPDDHPRRERGGAQALPPLAVPPPKGFDEESIWNMKVVGFNDGQGRPSSDDGWIENQNGRYIVYMTSTGGSRLNPLTGKVENSGTSLIDATDPAHPVYLANVPTETTDGAPHVAVCGGNTLPNGQKNHWYMIRHDGNTNWEVWDTTDPSKPARMSVLIADGKLTHHAWWECDTGIAYAVFQSKTDGWHANQHVYIWDLSDPAQPKFIRQFGLPGQ